MFDFKFFSSRKCDLVALDLNELTYRRLRLLPVDQDFPGFGGCVNKPLSQAMHPSWPTIASCLLPYCENRAITAFDGFLTAFRAVRL